MTPFRPVRGHRGSYLLGFVVVGVIVVRALTFFQGHSRLLAMLLLAGFGLVYALEPLLSARIRWFCWLYFPLQAALVLMLTNLRPLLDVTNVLYIPLSAQTLHAFGRRTAATWLIVYAILLTGTLTLGTGGVAGLALSLLFLAGGAFQVSYESLYIQVQADEAESQVLLAELQDAHTKLQSYTAQAEELAAARERNRLARELHDSVSQVIFSITLTAQVARLLLDRDPERVAEHLDRLQEMTSSALAQLRSLIAELRSFQDKYPARPPPVGVANPPLG